MIGGTPPPTFISAFVVGVAGGARRWVLVGPPIVAVVCRLVHLRLLLNGSVLAPLSGAALLREELRINAYKAQDVYM